MGMRANMPYQLWSYFQQDGYFFMDHGDIYYGCLVEFSHFPDSIFVVQPANRKKLLELKSNQSKVTIEQIKQLAWEIKDFEKIRDVVPGPQDIGHYESEPDLSWSGERIWKKMFVFGAGASAFSVLKDEEEKFRSFLYCPPIGTELFGSKFKFIIDKYQGVQLSLSSLKAFGNDVEGYFEDEWTKIDSAFNPNILARHINIMYYLRDLFLQISKQTFENFNDSNLYSVLVHKLQAYLSNEKKESLGFVSFNYDVLLDNYLAGFFGTQLNGMNDYINYQKNRFLLFKPHGSCNWGWRFSHQFLKNNISDIPKFLYENQSTFYDIHFNYLGSYKEMVKQNSWGHEYSLNDHTNGKFTIDKNKIRVVEDNCEMYFPSILIPYRDKDEMVMPYYHYQQMRQYLQSMEELYLIGWKGNEAKFNAMLEGANRLQKLIIVNPKCDEVLDKVRKHLRADITIERYDSFETFVKQVIF